MAFVLADRVRDTTTTTGTGTVTLSGTSPTGYQTFGDGIGNGNNTYYTINADSQWEVGIGTYSASGTTLSRNTVLASSNGGALVDFAIGIKDVYCDYPAEKAVTDVYGTALAATTAANLAGGAAGSIPYQTAANTTSLLAAGTGVLIGGATPSYTMSPSLTQVTVAGDPTVNLQVATKQYVDTQTSAGIHFHQPVRVESPINLNATYNNGTAGVGATLTNAGTQAALVIDGVTVSVADRVLVYEQTDETQNGIYDVTSVGSGSTNWVLTRSSDADTYVNASPDGLSQGSTVFVQQGTTGAGETYTCNTVGTIIFGTTAITFAQISSAQIYSAGTGLTLTGTTFSLTAPVATSLGGTGLTTFTSGGAVYATSASVLTTGTLPATAGGTGQSSYTAGDLLYATSATTLGVIADVATGNALISGGAGADPSYGKIGLTTHISGTLAVGNGGTGATSLTGYLVGNGTSAFTTTATIPTSDLSGTISLTTQVSGTLGAGNGGTGISSYTVGDILYASATTTLSSLADVATGNALISGGVSNPPSWGKIGLTTHVSGTLPVANGGSGATTLTGYLKGNGTSAFTASATIPAGDITGAALTKADDTNVTLTLGGSPSTALLAATSITAGWTGQLAVSRGGTGNSTLASGYLLKGNGVSPTSASVIYDDGTNAGIGTTSPGARLETYQSSGGTNAIRMNTNFASGNYVDFNPSISGVSNGGYSIALNGTIRQVISYTGDVGFGTSSPAAKLEINGGTAMTAGWNRSLMLSATYPVIVLNSNNTKYSGIGVDFGSAPAGMYFWVNGSSSDLSGTGTVAMSINTGNYVEAYGSFRAPIFYDSNNTAYYLNPETTSVVNTVQYGINYTSGGGGGRIIPSTGSPYSLRQEFGSDNSGWRYGIAKNVGGTVTIQFYVSDSGTAEAVGDMRAPIFYDSNNTGYYIDPASTSVTSQINVGTGLNVFDGAAVAPDPYGIVGITRKTDNNYSYLGFTRAGQHAMGMGIDTGNTFWIGGCSSGFNGVRTSSWLLMHTSGYVTAPVDMRAPIFYDSNNTAFYANMDGTSEFNTIQTRGGSGFRSFATPAASINSQIYFADAGNTRAWNWQLDENNNAALWNYNGSGWAKRMGVTSPDSELFLRNSSGSDVSLAYPSTFGYSSSYKTMVLGNQAYTTVCIGVSPASNASGSFNGAGSGVEVMFKNGVYFISPNSANNSYNNYLRLIDGYVQFTNSARAPIFYDSDNTGYYIDAAGTSNLNVLNVQPNSGSTGGGINFNGAGSTFIRGTSTDNAASGGSNLQLQSWFGIGFGPTISGQLVPIGENAAWIDCRNGDLTARRLLVALQDARAPIFYDYNNTAYYGDFAGVTNLADLRAPNVVHYPGWPGYPGVDANSYGFNAISSFTYSNNAPWTGPFVSFAAGGYNLQLNAPYGGSGGALSFRTRNGDTSTFNSWYRLAAYDANPGSGDLYAAIYYDGNNTGYYINPNGTSNIYQLTGAITYGSYGSFSASGTYNNYAGIAFPDVAVTLMANQGASGFYFNNNTWGMYCSNAGALYTGIFYDINDTSYYVDPNTTATSFRGRGQIFLGPNSSGQYLRLGGDGGATDHSTVSTSNGNLHIDAKSGYNLYLAWYNTSTVNVGGALYANGNITAYSDRRVKDNVETIPDALNKLSAIRGVTYTRTDMEDKERRYAGVIAQEIEAVLPEAVFEAHDRKSVDYNATIGLLIEAIKELENKVKALEAKE